MLLPPGSERDRGGWLTPGRLTTGWPGLAIARGKPMNEVVIAEHSIAVDATCARIRARWQDTVEAIIDVGRMLVEAKANTPHGAWQWMFSDTNPLALPFSWRTANCLMQVSSSPALTNSHHGANLPASWRTLYELARLPEPVLLEAFEAGRIRPDMERKHVKQLMPVERSRHDAQPYVVGREYCTAQDLASFPEKFATVYADPPWQYGNQGTRGATGDHYSGMTVDEICALPVSGLVADNAHLHLWTTNAFLFEARRVLEAWGFEYKSCFIWVKPQIGMGNYWRVSHEFLLFGIRGSLPFADKSLRSWGEFRRSQHSQKPEYIRDLIHKASPGPRLELFARRPVEGWTCWGNEIESNVFHGARNAA